MLFVKELFTVPDLWLVCDGYLRLSVLESARLRGALIALGADLDGGLCNYSSDGCPRGAACSV